jgi:hypothetical protein
MMHQPIDYEDPRFHATEILPIPNRGTSIQLGLRAATSEATPQSRRDETIIMSSRVVSGNLTTATVAVRP